MGIGLEVDAALEIGGKLDRMAGRLDQISAALNAQPMLHNSSKGMLAVANQTVIQSLGSPAGGVEYHVRRVSCGPVPVQADNLVQMGDAFYLAKGVAGTGNQWIVVDVAPQLPNAAFYSNQQLVIRHPDHLLAVWINGVGQLVVDVDFLVVAAHSYIAEEA